MRLKKLLSALLVTLTICTAIAAIAAPPLMTEAHGGHHGCKNESRLESYYYHCGGHPAHHHTHGVCPYANSVTTSNSSFSSSVTVSDKSYDNVAFNATYYANQYEDLYEMLGDDAESLYNHFIIKIKLPESTGISLSRLSDWLDLNNI